MAGSILGNRVRRTEDPELLTTIIGRSSRLKALVVSADPQERGLRAILNYGHTLAHALETAGRFDLHHGEAVAIGLLFAAHLARRLGRVDDARVAEHYRVVRAYGLADQLPVGSDIEVSVARDDRFRSARAAGARTDRGPRENAVGDAAVASLPPGRGRYPRRIGTGGGAHAVRGLGVERFGGIAVEVPFDLRQQGGIEPRILTEMVA